jgi:hypothetical protein
VSDVLQVFYLEQKTEKNEQQSKEALGMLNLKCIEISWTKKVLDNTKTIPTENGL